MSMVLMVSTGAWSKQILLHDIKEKADFYYVMNMMHSDYADVLGSDVGTYVKMAKAYMEDPDAAEGKVFCTWLGQMRRKEE